MIHCRASRLSNGASLFSGVKPEANPTFRRYLNLNSDSLNNCVVSCSIRKTRYNRKWFCSKNEVGVEIINSDEEDDAEKGKKRVKCQLEVISWRERRIIAEILVYADVDSVWNALTDYEHLADFVPNLVCSGRIPCPHPGRIWLEQRGVQRALYWQIEARVVLDLKELQHSSTNKELHFSMVDGDFKKFEGKWCVESGIRSTTTILSYEVNVLPRFNFPAIFLERIIRSDLPVNLQALACRAERNFYGNRDMKKVEDYMLRTSAASALAAPGVDLKSDLKENILSQENNTNSNLGLMLRPSSELSGNWGVFGKVCPLDKPCMVDEVHLRRFDGLLEDGGVHRCVFASITVKAPVREVWNVLTAYESLPEIVPNLAICKVLSRENGNVRILQEGCKGLLYMVLHARVVLDLNELVEQEISFKQIEGDFDSFEGKWFLEQLGSNHTLLKYTVESKMRKDTVLSEAIMEEVIYEDLPSNLCAIRDYVETKHAKKSETYEHRQQRSEKNDSCNSEVTPSSAAKQALEDSTSTRQRQRVPGLQRNMEILKAELLKFITEHGQEGFMPMRKQLRLHGRVDIEKAITHMGGFRRISSMMNLSLAYKHSKPKGYWDNLENLQQEIGRFQRSWGMDLSFMPSRKSFERAGRYDIARALEKWGGVHEVSRLLSLNVRYPNRQPNTAKQDKVPSNEEKDSSKPYVSQDPQKWVTKLKHFDIDWVEY